MCTFTVVIILVIITFSSFAHGAFVDESFKKGILALGVTKEQTMNWWWSIKKHTTPRVFPLCIVKKEKHWPSSLNNFASILDRIIAAEIRQFNPDLHSWVANKFNIKGINFRKIYEGPNSKPTYEMKNTVGLEIEFEKNVRGLIVQAISGPLGLPGGEFRNDIVCQDEEEVKNYEHMVPCSFTPRASYIFPNTYVVDAQKSPSGFKKLTARWQFTEALCHETALFQFLIINTQDFKEYHICLTDLIVQKYMHSKDGAPTQYYPGYQITCDRSSTLEALNLLNKKRIIPNMDYEKCLFDTLAPKSKGIHQYTCPPGFFECHNVWGNSNGWNTLKNTWKTKLLDQENYKHCCDANLIEFPVLPTTTTTTTTTTTKKPPSAPTPVTTPRTTPPPQSTSPSITTLPTTMATTITTLAPIQEEEKKLQKKSVVVEKKAQLSHGDICILVFLVIIPIADHISRYYKDFPDLKSFGLGFWIIAHVTLHSIGAVFLWYSFGLVVGTGEDKIGNISGRHFILGVLTTLIQLAGFLSGMTSGATERKAFKYVLMHSVGGYFGASISYIAVWFSNTTAERKYVCGGFLLIRVLSIVLTSVTESKQDHILYVYPRRAVFPILQRIKLTKLPPLWKTKVALLVCMMCTSVGLYAFMKFTYKIDKQVDLSLSAE